MDTQTFGAADKAGNVDAPASPLVPSTQPVIASLSRDAAGNVVPAGAKLIGGDRDEHVERSFHQLRNLLGRELEKVEGWAEQLRAHVETEIDALLKGETPPPLPAALKPVQAEAPGVEGETETTSAEPEGETATPAAPSETTTAAPGETETTSTS